MILDFAANHYLSPESEAVKQQLWDVFPTDLVGFDYKKSFGVGVQLKRINYKSLRVGNLIYLSHNPYTSERLESPINLALEKYSYEKNEQGEIIAQTKHAYFYLTDGSIYWDRFKLLPKDLNTAELRESVFSGRRNNAFIYLKGRAREIDEATNNAYDLASKMESFFDKFYVLKGKYVESGSLKISDSIEALLGAETTDMDWLKTEIPVAIDADGNPVMMVTGQIIQQTLIDATEEVSNAEIDDYLQEELTIWF